MCLCVFVRVSVCARAFSLDFLSVGLNCPLLSRRVITGVIYKSQLNTLPGQILASLSLCTSLSPAHIERLGGQTRPALGDHTAECTGSCSSPFHSRSGDRRSPLSSLPSPVYQQPQLPQLTISHTPHISGSDLKQSLVTLTLGISM